MPPWNDLLPLMLGSAAVGALVSAMVNVLNSVFSAWLTHRHSRIELAVELAKLEQSYQEMMWRCAEATKRPAVVSLTNPTYLVPMFLRALDDLARKRAWPEAEAALRERDRHAERYGFGHDERTPPPREGQT